jgi:hypothetical protein
MKIRSVFDRLLVIDPNVPGPIAKTGFPAMIGGRLELLVNGRCRIAAGRPCRDYLLAA